MLSTENYKIKQYSETPLDDLFSQLSGDREIFSPPAADETVLSDNNLNNGLIPGTENKPDESVIDKKELFSKRTNTAKFLAKNTDRAMAFVCAVIAETDDPNEWKANKEDVADIQEAYFEMCQSYGWSGMPPWMNLAIALTFTYGPIMKEAVKVRGLNAEVIRRAVEAEANLAFEKERNRVEKLKALEVKADVVTETPEVSKTPVKTENGTEKQ